MFRKNDFCRTLKYENIFFFVYSKRMGPRSPMKENKRGFSILFYRGIRLKKDSSIQLRRGSFANF